MRSPVLLGLTAAAALATSAFAQEAPPAPPVVAAPVAPVAPPAPVPAPADAAPAPVAEVPVAPPAPPPVPTDVTSVNVLNVLDRVCAPLVRGGDLTKLAPTLGFKKKRDVWVWAYTKGATITVTPPGTNPEVCTVDVLHPVDGSAPLIIDLHNWAMQRGWDLFRNDKVTSDLERTTRSWELTTATEREALVLVTSRKAGGAPLSSKGDQTQLLYSLYKLPPQ